MTTHRRFSNFQFSSENSISRRFGPHVLYGLIVLLVLVLYADNHRWLASWELGIQDAMVSIGRSAVPPPGVVVVEIDDNAVAKLGPWPWNSERIGYLIGTLSEYKPTAIGVDLELPTKLSEDPSGNQFLAEIVSGVGNVVLPLRFTLSEEGRFLQTAPEHIKKSSLAVIDEAARLFDYPYPQSVDLTSPYPEASKGAWALGHVNTWQDIDGRVRRDPLVVNYEGNYYASMALQLACVASNTQKNQIRIEPGEAVLLGPRRIPTDKSGMMRIDYRGPAHTVKTISAASVLEGRANSNDLAGKVVVIGLDASGYGSTLRTSASERMPRAEKLATVTANILDGRYITTVTFSGLLNILILFGIGVFCAVVMPRVTLLNRIIVLVVMGFLFLNLNYVLYHSFKLVTNTLYPTLEILFFLAFAPFVKLRGDDATDTAAGTVTRRARAREVLSSSGRTMVAGAGETAPVREVKDNAPVGAITGLAQTVEMSATPTRTEVPGTPVPVQDRRVTGSGGSTESGIMLTPSFDPLADSKSGDSGKTTAFGRTPEPVDFTAESSGGAASGLGTNLEDLKRLGRYEILGTLGQGAMGVVLKGRDPAIDRLVALKTIRVGTGIDPVQSAELRARLIREAKAAGKLSHPNIVTIYDVGTEGELDYIAMEYLEGYPLENLVQKKTTVNFRIIAKMLYQVCSALEYAHRAGIVHRDVKPANIMVLDDFNVKVTDFGIARFESGAMSMTQTGIAMGTPYYIAPEQLRGEAIDRRCDIFSLGVVAYELLTRQRPFEGRNISALIYAITQTNPDPPSRLDANIPGLFDFVVSKALAKDPGQRYQSAEDMGKDLEAFVEDMSGAKSYRR